MASMYDFFKPVGEEAGRGARQPVAVGSPRAHDDAPRLGRGARQEGVRGGEIEETAAAAEEEEDGEGTGVGVRSSRKRRQARTRRAILNSDSSDSDAPVVASPSQAQRQRRRRQLVGSLDDDGDDDGEVEEEEEGGDGDDGAAEEEAVGNSQRFRSRQKKRKSIALSSSSSSSSSDADADSDGGGDGDGASDGRHTSKRAQRLSSSSSEEEAAREEARRRSKRRRRSEETSPQKELRPRASVCRRSLEERTIGRGWTRDRALEEARAEGRRHLGFSLGDRRRAGEKDDCDLSSLEDFIVADDGSTDMLGEAEAGRASAASAAASAASAGAAADSDGDDAGTPEPPRSRRRSRRASKRRAEPSPTPSPSLSGSGSEGEEEGGGGLAAYWQLTQELDEDRRQARFLTFDESFPLWVEALAKVATGLRCSDLSAQHELAVRKVDSDMCTFRETLLGSMAWNKESFSAVRRRPLLRIGFGPSGITCDVCNRRRYGDFSRQATLFGPEYDGQQVWQSIAWDRYLPPLGRPDGSAEGDPPEVLALGETCFHRLRIYHKLFHFKFKVVRRIFRKLQADRTATLADFGAASDFAAGMAEAWHQKQCEARSYFELV